MVQVFRNPDLALSIKRSPEAVSSVSHRGNTTPALERYFRQIGGRGAAAGPTAHHPRSIASGTTDYRGKTIAGSSANASSAALRMLNVREPFDFAGAGFQSLFSLQRQASATRAARPTVRNGTQTRTLRSYQLNG